MATPTYELLDSSTLSSTATTFTFSSIPTTDSNGEPLKDLVLVIKAKITQATQRSIRCNLNSGGTYYNQYLRGTSAEVISQNGFSTTAFGLDSGAQFTNDFESLFVFEIIDYTKNKYKTIIMQGSNAGYSVAYGSSSWASTATVSSITIDPENTFDVGSTFKLYGIV